MCTPRVLAASNSIGFAQPSVGWGKLLNLRVTHSARLVTLRLYNEYETHEKARSLRRMTVALLLARRLTGAESTHICVRTHITTSTTVLPA